MKAGAAHALGAPQGREFGAGGGGSGTVELPLERHFSLQANAGGLVLAQGAPPRDTTLAQQETGSAFFGSAGVRLRPTGTPTGFWVDGNGGLIGTGNAMRPMVDAHIGWDFRVARDSRWNVGPFVGYTQIVQPNDALRVDDARIAWVGIEVSLGAPPAKAVVPPTPVEPPPSAPPPPSDADGLVSVEDRCPNGKVDEEDCAGEVKLVDDRIVLEDVIHFDFDSPRIRPMSMPLVRKIARFLRDHSEIAELRIEGHADAVGTEAYNQRLSEARAERTRHTLVELGVDTHRLLPIGHGRSRLKVVTTLAEMRNRRVEFIVVRKIPATVAARVTNEGSQ